MKWEEESQSHLWPRFTGSGQRTSSFCRPPANYVCACATQQLRREMLMEGVISILEGMNPRMIEIKLNSFLNRTKPALVKVGE